MSKSLSPAEVATLMADAKGWTPEEGDELQGVVLGIKWGYSDIKQAHYPIVFVLDSTGSATAIHGFQTVLENELRQQRPVPGEELYVKCLGVDPSREVKKGYSPTIRYAVYVKREGGTNDPWAHSPSQ